MKIHFIVHEVFEAPGAFEYWAIKNNYDYSFSRVYLGENLPTDEEIPLIDLLIVLGGPQSPATMISESPHFDASAEIAVIKDCIRSEKAVIGVCLGAQLIGEALGAKFEHSPFKEIGSFPIILTEEGKANQKFQEFPSIVEVGHWHGDMPGLTKDCRVLAYSEGCPRQIVEYSDLVYGFQCHLEFTSNVIKLLIENSEDELRELKGEKYIQSAERLISNNYQEMNELLFKFLDKLVERYQLK